MSLIGQENPSLRERTFVIRNSEVAGRIDPLYYFSVNKLSLVKETKYEVKKLSEVINMQRGRFGHRPRNDPRFYGGEYPFIQTGDIVKASHTGEKILYSQTLNELGLKTSRLFSEPVVVITIAANIGDTAILNFPSCFPDSLIAMTPKNDMLGLEYINVYFKFIKSYLGNLAPQSAQKNINYQQLAPVPIVIPPKEVQIDIVRIYNSAVALKQEKEREAKELIDEIDNYLLLEIGLEEPVKDNKLSSRVYTIQSSEIKGKRIDPDYYKTDYKKKIEKIDKSAFPIVLLSDITSLVSSGNTPSSTQYSETETEFPIIKVGSYTKDFINLDKVDFALSPQRLVAKKGDIFILSAAHQPEYVGRHIKYLSEVPEKNTSYVGELICIRTNKLCNSMYLFSLLNLDLFKTLINREKTGQTSHIYGKNLKNLGIPLPNIEKQNEISENILRLRSQAISLQKEANEILEKVKIQVQKVIIGK
ncbi:restriction endonuclease subunit S [Pseudoalteromonas fuliginea]|uniref:restriction endonuclease subunit S n=1 Tax=Pseudoalteromonas fuliginea TaxID=1872678 RepID=UPI00317597F5